MEESEALAVDINGYAQAFQISFEDARARLERLKTFSRLRVMLESTEPRFAGGFAEHEPEFILTLRFTGSEPLPVATTALIPGDLGATVDLGAAHTLAEILAGQRRLIATVYREYPQMGIGKSVARGAVRLIGPSALSDSELAALEAVAGVPVIVEDAPVEILEHQYGGKRMTDVIGGLLATCTSGFSVRDAVSGLTGVLTAGHCFSGDATYWEQPASGNHVATRSGTRWDANQDFAWYQVPHAEFPQFYWGGGMRTWTGTQPRLEMEDNPVCHYGYMSDQVPGENGASCGMVTDIHYVPSPASGVCNGQVCDAVWVLVEDAGTSGAYDIDCTGATVVVRTTGARSRGEPTQPAVTVVAPTVPALEL